MTSGKPFGDEAPSDRSILPRCSTSSRLTDGSARVTDGSVQVEQDFERVISAAFPGNSDINQAVLECLAHHALPRTMSGVKWPRGRPSSRRTY
eukprot:4226696-Prymnesium_polylepis.1